METTFYVAGEPAPPEGAPRPRTYFNVVGPRYFETMRIPLLRGREFSDADRDGAPRVAIVNETMAARRWPGESPIGKRVSIEGPAGPFAEVVGVAKDIRYNSLGETPPAFLYLPLEQLYRDEMVLHVRAAPGARPATVGTAVAAALRAMDPTLPPAVVKGVGEDQAVALLPARVAAALLGTFGALALLLAMVGIYGVTSYAVARRTREIGVRTALGARAGDVLRAVLGEAMRRVGLGAVVGLLLGVGVSRLLKTQLYGVGVVDPVTFVVTPLVLAAVALVAALVPARRAVRVDPMVALRAE
jgi:predicted permease